MIVLYIEFCAYLSSLVLHIQTFDYLSSLVLHMWLNWFKNRDLLRISFQRYSTVSNWKPLETQTSSFREFEQTLFTTTNKVKSNTFCSGLLG